MRVLVIGGGIAGTATAQKWELVGDTGDYTTASWYRWFLDGASRTGSAVVGKTFRAYCSFGCSHGSSGEYADLTVASSAPAAPPVDTGRGYRITGGTGRALAQVSGGSAVTSVPESAGSARAQWSFTPTGDGAFTLTNAATGRLLGVDSTGKAGRAWGARPTATAARTGQGAVGQQWFVLPATPAAGTYHLVDRYSGLALGLSAAAGRPAGTTAPRTWTATGGGVGGGRAPAEQTLSFTPTRPQPPDRAPTPPVRARSAPPSRARTDPMEGHGVRRLVVGLIHHLNQNMN